MTQINTAPPDVWSPNLAWHWISPDRMLAITEFSFNPNKSVYNLYRQYAGGRQWLGSCTMRSELFDPYRVIRRIKSARLRTLERRRRELERQIQVVDEREAFWRSR